MALLGWLTRLFRTPQTRAEPSSCLEVVANWLGIARLGRSPPGASGKRRHRRWALGRRLVLEIGDQQIEVETVDVSAAGAGFFTPIAVPVGAVVRLREPDARLGVPARVVHVTLLEDGRRYRAGVQFLLGGEEKSAPAALPQSSTAAPPTTAAPLPASVAPPPAANPPVETLGSAEFLAASPDPDSGERLGARVAPHAATCGTASPDPDTGERLGAIETATPPASVATAEAAAEDVVPPWWMPRGTPVLAPPLPADLPALPRDLIEFVERVIRHAELHLPVLPRVIEQALVMLQDEQTDYRRLAHVIEGDAGLTATLLRQANSAAAAGVEKITRLPDALARLGYRRIRATVSGVALRRVTLETSGLDPQRALQIWHSAVAAGAVMQAAAERLRLPAEEAFLVGLLHDLGTLAALRIAYLYRESYDPQLSPQTVERLCLEWHEPLGQALAQAWKLESPLPELCGGHHQPPLPDDPLALYRHLVQLADAVCALLEYAPYVPYDFFNLPCVQALGIRPEPAWTDWLAALPATVAERAGAAAVESA